MPVFGTSAATFNDDGVTALYQHLISLLAPEGLAVSEGILPVADVKFSSGIDQVVPPERTRYLAEITEAVRGYHATTDELVDQGAPAAAARGRRGGGAEGSGTSWPSWSTTPASSSRRGHRADRGLACDRRDV